MGKLQILGIPSVDIPGPKERSIFWTMICMRPHQFPHLHYSENVDLTPGCRHEMLDDMGDLIHRSLIIVINKWEEIADYFDNLLIEKNGLLRPDYHDSLLTDDSAFTRSKRYFWAIDFLKQAEYSIDNNIKQVARFVGLLQEQPPAEKEAAPAFATRMRKHCNALEKLETLSRRFRHKQEEAKALRDGVRRHF